MSRIERALGVLELCIKGTCAALTLLFTVFMLLQIVFRYFVNESLQWTETLSIYLMTWMVFLGAAFMTRRWEHIYIPSFLGALPPRPRWIVFIAAKMASLVFLTAYAWYGMESFNWPIHAMHPVLQISTKWVKLSLPVGAAIMTALCALSIARDVAAFRRGDAAHFAVIASGGGASEDG